MDRGLQTVRLLIMSSGTSVISPAYKQSLSEASERHGHQLCIASVRWKRHQRPSLAIAWIPANSLCDVQTVTGGHKTRGWLLFGSRATAHSARDHQTDAFCAAQHILDSCDPPSCPHLARHLGWHPRQKSHQSHDMVAPRPRCPLGHKSSTYSERA